MWGQANAAVLEEQKFRIIPTRVGTRAVAVLPQPILKDHPHACGDTLIGNVRTTINTGSSPRVWGQVFLQLPMILKPHIIPTRVGTSIHQDEATPHLQDHPHACGDK